MSTSCESNVYKSAFVAVGACAIDTILTVPHFPEEDSKLRASTLLRRRGGNCANTLEVLSLLNQRYLDQDEERDGVALHLLAVLPDELSPSVEFIKDSFEPKINTDYCLFRNEHQDPVQSFITFSEASGSRTIINYNHLPEMTFPEFKHQAGRILNVSKDLDKIWFHFEGRIPDVTLQCICWLRHINLEDRFPGKSKDSLPTIRISVELEKPKREGLQELAHHANVVFYSRSWAEGEGYSSPAECLRRQEATLSPSERVLVCTWGAEGASVLQTHRDAAICDIRDDVLRVLPFEGGNGPVIDAVGAGDTFIAGILYAMLHWDEEWPLRRKLLFANELAGRKVRQNGFQGLDEKMKHYIDGVFRRPDPALEISR